MNPPSPLTAKSRTAFAGAAIFLTTLTLSCGPKEEVSSGAKKQGEEFKRDVRIIKMEANVATLVSYIQIYTVKRNGQPPPQAAGLRALVTTRILNDASLLTDPWGEPVEYKVPGSLSQDKFDVWSKGPDKISGTADDIGNWTPEQSAAGEPGNPPAKKVEALTEQARITKMEADVATLVSYIQVYTVKNRGQLPSQATGLRSLVTKGILADESLLTDPWGEPVEYKIPGSRSKDKFDVFSKGPDKISATEDDVGNWTLPE